MKLTADTITDEQIRELREQLLSEHFQNHHGCHKLAMVCNIALHGTGALGLAKIHSRARIAEILNTRDEVK